jgi:hypothetical protein
MVVVRLVQPVPAGAGSGPTPWDPALAARLLAAACAVGTMVLAYVDRGKPGGPSQEDR